MYGLGQEVAAAFSMVWAQQGASARDSSRPASRSSPSPPGSTGRSGRRASCTPPSSSRRQQGQVAQALGGARLPYVGFAQGVYAAQRAVRDFVSETIAAARGMDGQVVRFPWLLSVRDGLAAVGRFAREVWHTVRGEDQQVTEFPFLLRIRAGLEAVGRFAGEAWAAITGRTWAVTEFPLLLTIRSAVTGTFQFVRDFAREAWQAIAGQAQDQQPRFPWLYAAADAVRGFVADVPRPGRRPRRGLERLRPETWLGTKLQTVMQLADQAKAAWADVRRVFDDKPDAQQNFSFPWIKELAADVRSFAST